MTRELLADVEFYENRIFNLIYLYRVVNQDGLNCLKGKILEIEVEFEREEKI